MKLNDFLKNTEPSRSGRRCSICSDAAAASDAKQIADGMADGSIAHTVHHLWEKFFAPTHGTKSPNTLRNHLRRCLGADI
jgi:hypothetical protein